MAASQTTADHDTIRSWAEDRGGRPASVEGTEDRGDDAGVLRIDFQEKDDRLDEISWDDWFDKFESEGLAFLYQDEKTSGEPSTFFRLVRRDS